MQGNHLTRRVQQILRSLKIKSQLGKSVTSGKGGNFVGSRSSVSKCNF